MEALAPPTAPADGRDAEKRNELLLDALKAAVAAGGDHRLFRWGKLDGLFPSKTGTAGAAATFAVSGGLLELARTETKGRLVVEWVRATPKAVGYLHDHDSPKATLRELREVIGSTRAGVPVWMQQARDEASQLATRFEHHAREMLKRLDALSDRVDAALRRLETAGPAIGESIEKLVPWAAVALAHLDRRRAALAGGCPLPELFHAVREQFSELTVPAFHDGLRRLADLRTVRLSAGVPEEVTEPEFAMVFDGRAVWTVGR